MPHTMRLALGAATLAICTAFSPARADAETLHYAIIGEPPSLDIQMGTATLATTIGQHVFETLYAFDSKTEPHPMLADSETVSEDGRTIVMQIRQGVPFHNGQEMKAADVAASLARWGEFGARGAATWIRIRRGHRRLRGDAETQGAERGVEELSRFSERRPRDLSRRPRDGGGW